MVAASVSAGSGTWPRSLLRADPRARYVALIAGLPSPDESAELTRPLRPSWTRPLGCLPPARARSGAATGAGSQVTGGGAGEGFREKQIAGWLKKMHPRTKPLFVCASVAGFGRMCAAGGLEWAALHRAFLWLYNFGPFTKIVEKLFSPSNRGESECQSFFASSWLHNAGTVCRGWQTAAFRSPLETPRVHQPSGRCCAGKQVAR